MTWRQLAMCQRAAAHYMLAAKEPTFDRAVCSRAYYAAYAIVTSRLPRRLTFGRGWRNPEHARLPLYADSIAGLTGSDRQAMRRALRRLRQRREDGDYRPGVTVDRAAARESLRDAAEVFRILD